MARFGVDQARNFHHLASTLAASISNRVAGNISNNTFSQLEVAAAVVVRISQRIDLQMTLSATSLIITNHRKVIQVHLVPVASGRGVPCLENKRALISTIRLCAIQACQGSWAIVLT